MTFPFSTRVEEHLTRLDVLTRLRQAGLKELLALVWGVRHFRPYLFSRMFIARTDHNSLKWLHNFQDPEGQVARWLDTILK